MKRPALLDSSYLIDLERKAAADELGPARPFLPLLRGRALVVSLVTAEDVLEGAADESAASSSLQRFGIDGLHLAGARRYAFVQRRSPRRLGENDAWLVATAQSVDAEVVGADRADFERLGDRYLRFR